MHPFLVQVQAAAQEAADYQAAMYRLALITPASYDEIVPIFKRYCARSVGDWQSCYLDLWAMSARGDYSWLQENAE